MFIRKKCCVQNKRVRRNFKIKKIDFLRKREFWAVLNTRTLSNFRGRKVTIKLEKTNEGDVKQRRENPLSSSSSPPPPQGTRVCFCNRATSTLLVSAIIRQRNPFVERDTSEISFRATYPRHETTGVSYCRAIAFSSIMRWRIQKECVCVKESYIYRGVYPFSMGEENKSVEK